ncbi:MAG: hypothetical protein IBX64_05795 [Actinobacteria bacterium]|nr:hypothetical protein [Actinomycetota bacterium]
MTGSVIRQNNYLIFAVYLCSLFALAFFLLEFSVSADSFYNFRKPFSRSFLGNPGFSLLIAPGLTGFVIGLMRERNQALSNTIVAIVMIVIINGMLFYLDYSLKDQFIGLYSNGIKGPRVSDDVMGRTATFAIVQIAILTLVLLLVKVPWRAFIPRRVPSDTP